MRELVLRRLTLEELTRRRRADDYRRYLETFRRAAVDANPHQIEAAMFALDRLEHGGAVLADEVGLGKTIETGIVLSQLRATGRGHTLIVVPLALAGQWQVELDTLFSLSSTILGPNSFPDPLPSGLYIAGREFVTTPRWGERLQGPWDLVVVDEAHELFANIHNSFSRRNGAFNQRARGCSRAVALKRLIGSSPVLVLTATPLQNNLFELWGLVHYADRGHRVLGPFHEFCSIFCGPDGKEVKAGLQETLRDRLTMVVQRTLRDQAAPFLEKPFTRRTCHTVNFHMEAAIRELYSAVDNWLSGPIGVYRHRHLISLQLRRRMGSSPQALVSSLASIRARLQGLTLDDGDEFELEDLQEEREDLTPERRELLHDDEQTLAHLEALARGAVAVPQEKFRKTLEWVEKVDKVVIFTESRRTLEALATFLKEKGHSVTCLSGSPGPEAQSALVRWEQEVGRFMARRPDPSALMRQALVHEFKVASRVLISTEAGAKGLNLQFCSTLINFDLPWNPQRIEQRIGRVHRYGQTRDVTIVNCVNLDNSAEQRVYSILRDKLRLFEGLFGASDDILGAVGSVLDLEHRVNHLLMSSADPTQGFDQLDLEIDELTRRARDGKLAETRSLLARLDSSVRDRFKSLAEDVPRALSEHDQALLALIPEARDVHSEGLRTRLRWKDRLYHLGPPQASSEWGEPLHLEHPWLVERCQEIRRATQARRFEFAGPIAGEWQVFLVEIEGLEFEERLEVVGLGDLLEALKSADFLGSSPVAESPTEDFDWLKREIDRDQQSRLSRLLAQLDNRLRDLEHWHESQRTELEKRRDKQRRVRVGARSAAESRQAESEWKKLVRETEDLESQQRHELSQLRSTLERERESLQQRRYARLRARFLLTVSIREADR